MARSYLKKTKPATTPKRDTRTPGEKRSDHDTARASGKTWSPQQLAIFGWFERLAGNLVVLARAGCLAGDTVLNINRGGKGSPMTIEKVVAQFNGAPPLVYRPDLDCYQRMRPWDVAIETKIARADGDRVRLGVIANAWCSGVKRTYTVTTDSGRSVRATDEHPFLLESGEWVRLDELTLGSRVQVNIGQGGTKHAAKVQYSQTDTKFHPYQINNGKRRWKVAVHRLVVEAAMNKMDYGRFIDILRTDKVVASRLSYLDPTQVVHHKDGDETNNDLENLHVLSGAADHSEQHDWGANVLARIGAETVVSIEEFGDEITYDVAVADDPHCFLANGFVVHNTGKTTTIIEAIHYVPDGVKILLCAFNKKIQAELESRITKGKADAKTLHALGFGFVREQWGSRLDITTDVEWDRLDEALYRVAGDDVRKEERVLLMKLVSRAKGTVTRADDAEGVRACAEALEEASAATDEQLSTYVEIVLDVLRQSVEKDEQNRLSFDDMLFVPIANDWVTPRYDVVIVDEYQDMNPIQLELARRICKQHLGFVGDDMQAIYAFRGADSGFASRLVDEIHATTLPLNVTYRCPKAVVAVAQQLVPDFVAHESAPEGEVRFLDYENMLPELRPGDAVLSRINFPLVGVCLALLKRDVPAVVSGRDIGKGLVEIVNKVRVKDWSEFAAKLDEWQQRRIERLSVLKTKKTEKKIEKKIDELCDRVSCIRSIAETVDSTDALRAKLDRLFQDRDDRRNVVTCSSVHKAKGLEWPRVYLLTDTLYMRRRRKGEEPAPPSQEEANIHYVAVTRAQNTLVEVQGGLGRAVERGK